MIIHTLVRGQKIDVTKNHPEMKGLLVDLNWNAPMNMDVDASAFLVGFNGKSTKEEDFVFYGRFCCKVSEDIKRWGILCTSFMKLLIIHVMRYTSKKRSLIENFVFVCNYPEVFAPEPTFLSLVMSLYTMCYY